MIRTIEKVANKYNGVVDYNYNTGELVGPCVGVITETKDINNIVFTFIDNRWRKPSFSFLEDDKAAIYWPGVHYTDEQLQQIKNDPTLDPELVPNPIKPEEKEVRTTITKPKTTRKKKEPKTKRNKNEMTEKQKVVFNLISEHGPITVDGLIEKDNSFTKKGMVGVVASMSRKGLIKKTDNGWNKI